MNPSSSTSTILPSSHQASTSQISVVENVETLSRNPVKPPPSICALSVGGDVRLQDVHFETYNDPNIMIRLLAFALLLLLFLASVFFFLSPDNSIYPTSSPTGKNYGNNNSPSASSPSSFYLSINSDAFDLDDTRTSSVGSVASTLADLIYNNIRGIAGMMLVFWYAVWCFFCWLWRSWRPNEDGDGVTQRCARGFEKVEGHGTLCWVLTSSPSAIRDGSNAWSMKLALLED